MVEVLRLVEQQLEVMLVAVVEVLRLVEQQLEVMLVEQQLEVMLEVEVERLGAQQVKEQVPVWRVILEIKVQNC